MVRVKMPEYLWAICNGLPPTALAITGLPFHNPSDTVRPKPSLSEFYTALDARCKALTSISLVGGRKRMKMSLSWAASASTSAMTFAPQAVGGAAAGHRRGVDV